MESNSKKNGGFGLIEVVISMAIMGIISVSVYTGYIMAIKHTKEGQVKQEAALEGKKVVEEIKSTNIQLPTDANGMISIGSINLKEISNTGVYTRFLDENFSDIDETSAKYAEVVSVSQTKTDIGNINFNDNQSIEIKPADINYQLNISKETQLDTIKDFISDGTSPEKELQGQGRIILSLYVKNADTNSRIISINDYKGTPILSSGTLQCTSGKVNISINFNSYKQIGSSTLKPVVINVYNLTTDIPNVYVEKPNSPDLNVDVEIFKGQMNYYNNRAEDPQKAKIGSLYDIKVELMDYSQYKDDQTNNTHDETNNLFTAYYNQNIQ